MRNENNTTTKTVINVGYCESTSEWLNRIMKELADESKNFVDLSVLCYLFCLMLRQMKMNALPLTTTCSASICKTVRCVNDNRFIGKRVTDF